MRKRTLILICLLLPLIMTGCFDSHEIGDFAYVTAMGIDQGISDTFRLTFQISKFSQGGGGGGENDGGGGEKSEDMEVITLDASSLLSAVALINSNISKELNFMHLKVIVLSEEISKSGKLQESIAPIIRYRHIRRTTNIIVSKGNAEEFIAELKPYPGELITKTLEELFKKSSTTGYFYHTTLNDLYDGIKSPYHALLLTYGSVNEEDKFESEGDAFEGESDIPGNFYAGEIPRKGGSKIELFGSTVFDGDKMVGKLTGFETQMLLMVRGELKRGPFSITDPSKPDVVIPIDISEFEQPEIEVDLSEEKPKIHVKLKLEGDIASIQSGIDYETPERIPIVEDAFEKYLTKGIEDTFEKCKKLKADVFKFGTTAVCEFWTIPEWEEYNWLGKFSESELEVEVDFTIRRTGKLLRSEPIYSSEGKE
ncbi:MAG TPA: Ger(x)C family spore germination protein [Clostridiaceae bacterium]|nr:Ger(x)C family spore germination protein [Clostridiaceae bacterium]